MAKGRRSHQDVVNEAKAIVKDIRNKVYKPLYLLHGEEAYYIDLLTKVITTEVLEEHERDFNQSVLYASDTKPEEVAGMARQYPVMAAYQVIVVKECQNWRSFDALMPLATHPVATTIAVICMKGKNFDKRTAFYKAASKIGVEFQSDKLAEWDVQAWLENYCREKGIKIEDRAVAQLGDHIGNHLGNLMNALEKLELVCKDAGIITEHDVAENIGISKDFNVFELNRAIGQRNAKKALTIANYFANNEKEHNIVPTTSMVYSYFRKIAVYQEFPNKSDRYALAQALGTGPGFVKEYADASARFPARSLVEAFEVIHDIDLKAKGVRSSSMVGSGDLVKELVGRLLRV